MNKRTASLIGITAVLLLLAGVFCGAAAADNAADNGNVAKIVETGTEYATVQAAINAASNGQTVQMIANSREMTIVVEKTIILDLNGHILSNIVDSMDTHYTGTVIKISMGNLTLKDTCTPAPVRYFKITDDGTNLLDAWVLDGNKTEDGADSCIDIDDIDSYNGEHGWAKKEGGKYVYKYVKITGGCITGGTGTLEYSRITGLYYGGGVSVTNRGTFTMEGGCIVGNKLGRVVYEGSLWGGGVCIAGDGIFTMKGGYIAGNSAEYGGGVYSGDYFNMEGGKIIGNTGCGGGVMLTFSGSMTGGKIIGNTTLCRHSEITAFSNGGGVSVATGSFTMSGGRIAGNFASEGGGVYSGGTFTISGGTITDNKVSNAEHGVGNGGGVYAGGTFNVSGGAEIFSNMKEINGSSSANNVHLESAGILTLAGSLAGDVRISKVGTAVPAAGDSFGTAAEGVTAADAAHIRNDSGSLGGRLDGSTLKWTNGPVCYIGDDQTKLYYTVSEALADVPEGGTIHMIADSWEETVFVEKTITLDLHGHVLSNNNLSKHSRSVLWIKGELTLQDTCTSAPVHYFKITDGDRTNLLDTWMLDPAKTEDGTDSCIAIDDIDSYNGGNGWAKKDSDDKYVYKYVKVTGGCITGGRGFFSDGEIRGGGVMLTKGGTFTMNGGNIVGNGCIFEDGEDMAALCGGGIYVDSTYSVITINGGYIAGNTAQLGGGIYSSTSPSPIYINGGKIIGNTALSGGGVMTYGSCTMTGGEIIGNTGFGIATDQGCRVLRGVGSGVTITSVTSTFTMSGGRIAGNFASDGGGVYVVIGTFTMSGGTITDNKVSNAHSALGGNGGGVYVSSYGTFEMNNGYISSNTAVNGGGVYVANGGTFEMKEGGTLSSNTASGNGGGIYVANGGTFKITNSGLIHSNNAENGGGVYNNGTFEMNHGTIGSSLLFVPFPNTADENGGGVYNAGTFIMTGGTLSVNTAKNGGGVYNTGTFIQTSDMNISSALASGISRNSAGENGGGVYNTGTFSLSGFAKIIKNMAGDKGGGVYNIGTFEVCESPTVKDNTKTSDKSANNVYLDNGTLMQVTGDFSGEICITYPTPESGNGNKLMTPFGRQTSGENGASNFSSDKDVTSSDNLAGYKLVYAGTRTPGTLDLVWSYKPAPQYGIYIAGKPTDTESLAENSAADSVSEEKVLLSAESAVEGAFITILTSPGYSAVSKDVEIYRKGPQEYYFTMPGHDVVIEPVPVTYPVTAKSEGKGRLTVSPAEAAEGQTVTITAEAVSGSRLSLLTARETESGAPVEIDEEDNTFTMPAAAVTVTAVFRGGESSKSQGTSIWLTEPTETPTPEPTVTPTVTPTQGIPTVKPVTTETPAAKSPMPLAGLLAGLGAAAAVLAAGRK